MDHSSTGASGIAHECAHISRETCYQHCSDKQDCFLAAFDEASNLLISMVEAAVDAPDDPPLQRVDRVLAAYLGAPAAEPMLARALLIEVYGAGRAAVSRRLAVQERSAVVIHRWPIVAWRHGPGVPRPGDGRTCHVADVGIVADQWDQHGAELVSQAGAPRDRQAALRSVADITGVGSAGDLRTTTSAFVAVARQVESAASVSRRMVNSPSDCRNSARHHPALHLAKRLRDTAGDTA